MGDPAKKLDTNAQRDTWLYEVEKLVAQVRAWVEDEGWIVSQTETTLTEPQLGTYTAPVLRFRAPGGDVLLEPVARQIVGSGDGRVDLFAWPSLNKVKLILQKGEWRVYTDSNVRWPKPWDHDAFIELATELASSR